MPTAREIELLRVARTSGIQSREEIANFMAQVTHESSDLTDLEEGFRYTRGIDQIPVRSAFRQGRVVLETARVQALNGQPEPLADLMYGDRMGNDDPGDGYLYRGRGYIQITGTNNYRAAGASIGLDLEGNPDLATEPTNAAQIAVWFWQTNVPETVRENVRDATLAINGGHNGLDDRTERYGRWHAVLTPEFLADLDAGRITPDTVPLRQGGKGPEVRSLQESLVKLGITSAKGEALVPDGNYGKSTKEAVAKFQNQHCFHLGGAAGGAYVTGIANLDTLEAIKGRISALDPLHGVRHAGDQFLPPGHRTDWLEIDAQGLPSYLRMNNAPNPTHKHEQVQTPAQASEQTHTQAHEHQQIDAFVTDSAQARLAELQSGMDALRRQIQHDKLSPNNGPAPRHEADLHTGVRSVAMSAPGRSNPERESEPPQPHPKRDAQAIPTDHRDYALFEAIRRQLPSEYSDDMAAHVMLQAKQGGIVRPDQIGGMGIENGSMVVMGKSGVDWAIVALGTRAPAMQETLGQSQAFDQQQTQQHEQWLAQEAQLSQGRGMSRSL